jgi:flagellin-like hook-associated protein FlgL
MVAYPMAKARLEEQGHCEVILSPKTRTVTIRRLEIQDQEFYDVISNQKESMRAEFITKALKIGSIALQDIAVVEKTDYIKREFQRLCDELDKVLMQQLGEEGMHGELDSIFSENGTLHQCLDRVFGNDGKLVRDILDMNNKKSPIGQLRETIESYFVGKESQVYGMLDPHAKDSPLCCLREELMKELNQIQTMITEQVARKGIIDITPKKGFVFEETLEYFLLEISKSFGDSVENVSTEKGKLGEKKGDFVIVVNDPMTEGKPPKIVVEAKTGTNLSLTQKGLMGDLDGAIQNREASFAIGVAESVFSDTVGCYREFGKDKIVCAFGDDGLPLEVAYKVARARILLSLHRESKKEIDTASICGIIDRIGNDLNAVQGIKAKLTSIATTSDKIKEDIEKLQDNIRRSLSEMQTLIRIAPT